MNIKIIKIFIVPCFFFLLPLSIALANDCSGAIELFNQGTLAQDIKQKEDLLKDALTRSCDGPKILAKIHNNLADAYENQSKLQEAIIEYKKAIVLDPTLPTPYISLGDVFSKLKDYKSAEEYYKKYGELTHFKTRGQLHTALTLKSIQVKPAKGDNPSPSEDLYFGFNEAFLNKESERQLQELLAALGDIELKNYRYQLAGHTCSIGSDAYNQKLSEDRAKAVKDWLVKNGYPAAQLLIMGCGKKKPVADNSTEAGRKLNRRVEIKTLGVGIRNETD